MLQVPLEFLKRLATNSGVEGKSLTIQCLMSQSRAHYSSSKTPCQLLKAAHTVSGWLECFRYFLYFVPQKQFSHAVISSRRKRIAHFMSRCAYSHNPVISNPFLAFSAAMSFLPNVPPDSQCWTTTIYSHHCAQISAITTVQNHGFRSSSLRIGETLSLQHLNSPGRFFNVQNCMYLQFDCLDVRHALNLPAYVSGKEY